MGGAIGAYAAEGTSPTPDPPPLPWEWVEIDPLATVDESSYTPHARFMGVDKDLRMGEDHPVVWINCPGMGRSLYATMGHWADAFEVREYRQLLDNALGWASGEGHAGCE